jgi:hypothetical protein
MPPGKALAAALIAAVVLVGGIVAIVALDNAFSQMSGSPPTHRPNAVPANAVWAGGPDGGSYFLCTVDQARNVNPCTVWNEETGEVMANGDFWVSGQDRAATSDELKYRWYDGRVIGMQVLTVQKRYLTLERAPGLRPVTVCDLVAQIDAFQNEEVAVLGRLDVTNGQKVLIQRGCPSGSSTGNIQISTVRVVEIGGPDPPKGQLYLNERSVSEKLAIVKSTTTLDYVPAKPAGQFRSWAVVYGRVVYTRDSTPPITLQSTGNGISFIPDR